MLYWYIFFALTGREQQIANKINQHFDNEAFTAFIPMLEVLFRNSGKVHKEMKIMFPGYVFIESGLCSAEFLQHTSYIVRTSKDVIKILRYGDSDEIAVREVERTSLMCLCNDNHCIETSVGFAEGDRIYIEKGPLEGRESMIRKINRHKMKALIDLEIMGGLRQVAIGLEVLKKI
ncbi:MAG: antiterminator LoaP [Clostridia bacterium]|jgi:transcriptional antiterminator NusG|nr:antiterminator LoaP [Clostridia bacterium]MDD3092604.1 antiterminator LoaP [Clostridia bacterium]MDD3970570.1 antiterminator LoaP [Clostridia bacterium]